MVALVGALVLCHLDYGCSSWYNSASKIIKNKLQTSQNKFVRIFLKLPGHAHLDHSCFESFRWLKVEERVSQIKLCLVHQIVHSLVPRDLYNYFNSVRDNQTIPLESVKLMLFLLDVIVVLSCPSLE
jgi:hypothetical protein